jgi:predicted TIM-barrel fold metal-dependent hydrolase
MPYVTDRLIHDADAHIMETPDWLDPYLDPAIAGRVERRPLVGGVGGTGDSDGDGGDGGRGEGRGGGGGGASATEARFFARMADQQADPEYRARDEELITIRKNWEAPGSWIAADRPAALDHLGFASQLLFNTFDSAYLDTLEKGDDLDLAYGVARAHNRAMVDFCSVDRRLLPTCYVPLADFDRSAAMAAEAVGMGAAALLMASSCPAGHSPSHIGLDPVWASAAEAGIPVVFHVGGGGRLLDPNYFRNGLPVPPDFHGGAENFRSVDYMAIPGPPMQTLATMIFDGVLERFPTLRIGVIEQGAIWVPGWMRQMESAMDAFVRHEERLQHLSLRPSEYVQRQIRVTPYPTEDVGWIAAQGGEDVVLFSSDYPHVEGGRRPIERFERSLGDAGDEVRRKFYVDNFVDLMGRALDVLEPAPA